MVVPDWGLLAPITWTNARLSRAPCVSSESVSHLNWCLAGAHAWAASESRTNSSGFFIFGEKAPKLSPMLLFVGEDRDAQVLRDVVETVAEFNNFGVLIAGCVLGIDDPLDDGDKVRGVLRGLKRDLGWFEGQAARYPAANGFDSIG